MFPLMAELIVACCHCLEPTYLNYTNCNLTVQNLDNSGAEPIVTNLNTIPKSAFGIRIVVNRNEDTCAKSNKSLFFQSAYAFSCECPPEFQYLPLDSITSVEIITINAFNSEHLGHTEVSEYFYIYQKHEFFKINEYINNVKTVLYDFENPTLAFDLLLMSPPTIGTEHQFEVKVELSDGRILSAQTELLELK